MPKTTFNKPQTYSVFVYNSSGSQSGNRFNTFSDLMTATAKPAGRKIIIGEQNETIPSGSYDFTDCEFWGNGQDAATGGVTWTFPTGVTISAWGSAGVIDQGMKFKSTSSSAIFTTSSNFSMTVRNVATLSSTTAEFISTSGASFVLSGSGNARLKNEGYEIVKATGAAWAQQVITNWFDGTTADANLIRSTNGQIVVYVLSTVVLDASLYPPVNANLVVNLLVLVNFIYAANIQYNYATKTVANTPVTVTKSVSHNRANAVGGNMVYNLPATTGGGYRFTFKKTDASANTVTVTPNGAETIDGAATYVLNAQYQCVTIEDVGGGVWDIIT